MTTQSCFYTVFNGNTTFTPIYKHVIQRNTTKDHTVGTVITLTTTDNFMCDVTVNDEY